MSARYRLVLILFLLLSSSLSFKLEPACGQTYQIKEMTPPVATALDNRRVRFDQLKKFKEQGVIGENNQGYVELLIPNDEAKGIVEKENIDRRVIYTAIVDQNNLPAEAITTFQKVFAQVQRDKANTGEKFQAENGTWVTK